MWKASLTQVQCIRFSTTHIRNWYNDKKKHNRKSNIIVVKCYENEAYNIVDDINEIVKIFFDKNLLHGQIIVPFNGYTKLKDILESDQSKVIGAKVTFE